MSLNSKMDQSIETFKEQKRAYREYVRNRPLIERLRDLEALQEQSYELMRIREINGGRPISRGWQCWAEAQNDPGLKK